MRSERQDTVFTIADIFQSSFPFVLQENCWSLAHFLDVGVGGRTKHGLSLLLVISHQPLSGVP